MFARNMTAKQFCLTLMFMVPILFMVLFMFLSFESSVFPDPDNFVFFDRFILMSLKLMCLFIFDGSGITLDATMVPVQSPSNDSEVLLCK